MRCTKGIILAGGTGSRLYPLTRAVNKQLLPIYDKPTIYYPLSTLMLAGIQEIFIISNFDDIPAIESLLGDGSHLGLNIQYKVQEKPRGLPEAFLLAEKFMDGDPVAMVLGDNLFYGHGFSALLDQCANEAGKTHIFLYNVKDPSRYGVAQFDSASKITDVVEKPKEFISPWAITGLYFFTGDVPQRSRQLKPSARGELEITDLIRSYIKDGCIVTNKLSRGNVWFDVGTPEALLQGSNFVEVLQNRQNILIASPEEIAWRMGMINLKTYQNIIDRLPKCAYRESLEMTLVS